MPEYLKFLIPRAYRSPWLAATGFRPQTKPGTGTFSTAVLTRLRPCFLFLRMFACPSRSSSCWRRQRLDPARHASEQPARQMALRQHQPVVPGILDQPAAGPHQPLLQTRRRPVVAPLRQRRRFRPHIHQPAGARRPQSRPHRDRLAVHRGKGRGWLWDAPGRGWSTRVSSEAVPRRAHNPLAEFWHAKGDVGGDAGRHMRRSPVGPLCGGCWGWRRGGSTYCNR